ncbi:MAG: hypothetical protein ACK4GN_00910 [Runella sp.]
MKKVFITLLSLAISSKSIAQDCMGLPIKIGMGFEMLTYNAKDKPTGRINYQIKEVKSEGGATLMKMEMQVVDEKNKPQSATAFTCRCKGNEMSIETTSLASSMDNPMLKDAKMQFTSKDMVYTNNYQVGTTLPDASLEGSGDISGMAVSYSMNITNRKIASQENLTVPAGTFNAYKITSDSRVNTRTIVNVGLDFQTTSYRTPNVLWDLKTESYRNGKLMSYSVLSKIF